MYISQKKVASIFSVENHKYIFDKLEQENLIPPRERYRSGAVFQKGWKIEDLPKLGEKIGFFKKPTSPIVATLFTTKGGVLKTTMAMNLARTAALHGLKTLVIGLDIQCDITNALGAEFDFESDNNNFDDAVAALESVKGLSSIFSGQANLEDVIYPTDLEHLFLIPETAELAALNESLGNINRREYWLRDKVINRLKNVFDLIILDCSPNWNRLTTNALVSSDLLISPLECKINNFRNFKVFKKFIDEFKQEMLIDLDEVFIPTKFAQNKKLSMDIKNWYQQNLVNCFEQGIPESTLSEEASALKISLLEHNPTNKVAKEMCGVLKRISDKFQDITAKKQSANQATASM
jgi:chromosome partitioning protein